MSGNQNQNHPANRLTVAKLRADGWLLVEVVERLVKHPPPGHRRDLYGIVDVLAVGPQGTLGIQATSVGGVSDRLRKARTERLEAIQAMHAAGWDLWIWGWHQPRGPRTRWVLGREVDLSTLTGSKESNP